MPKYTSYPAYLLFYLMEKENKKKKSSPESLYLFITRSFISVNIYKKLIYLTISITVIK